VRLIVAHFGLDNFSEPWQATLKQHCMEDAMSDSKKSFEALETLWGRLAVISKETARAI
jgi:hypothetical protein